ncbi:MAG TPA: aminoacyl-tRNA hydrolase [Rhodothermales bacterium]|nr:aminoacyl-tRNA hydrolase [Rhodothermales bacterium]
MAGTRLIVGLGNPGPDYQRTRHNVGFEAADRIAEKAGLSTTDEGIVRRAVDRIRGSGLYDATSGRYRGRTVVLAKPKTFMNRSGAAVAKLKGRFGVDTQDILVVVDDIYLDIGTLRIRASGGSGGHNGLEDIIDALDSDNFPRMRIGVGSSFRRGRQADYVLEAFSDEERPVVDDVIDTAAEAALTWVTDGVVTTMNRFNKRI